MDKNAIKKYAVWARRELISRVAQRAALYDITEKNTGDPAADSVHGQLLTTSEKKQRQALITQIKQKNYQEVMEEVAYTWFNRFSALRFMEVNGYLPSHVRVFTDDDNAFKPQILTEAINLDLDGLDMDKVYELKNDNKTDELFKYLVITQCNALSSILPVMFQKIDDYTELLFPDNLLREGSVIEQLIVLIPEDDFNIQNDGQVEIIGWLYQYYNTDLFNAIFDGDKSRKSLSSNDIPAATQLFTPDWAVRYMVENSLGRYWVDGHSQSLCVNNWKYFLSEPLQEPDTSKKIAELKKTYERVSPEEITLLDCCMGSGHILVYSFEVLMQIYEEYGYTAREAVQSIIEKNIYGLDIDERAAQLAYFAIMMKARQYDRRFFSRHIQPNVYEIKESNSIDRGVVDYFCGDDSSLKKQLDKLLNELFDAKEYGSILKISPFDYEAFFSRYEAVKNEISLYTNIITNDLLPLVKAAQIISNKYDVVVTNPPYLGSARMSNKLTSYIKNYYEEGKADFSTVMYLCVQQNYLKENGFVSFITTNSWMFLKSFVKVRNISLSNLSFDSIVDYGTELFEGKIGHLPIVAWVARNNCIKKKFHAVRLVDYKYGRRDEKQIEFYNEQNHFYADQEEFDAIDGTPIVYWISEKVLKSFDNANLESLAEIVSGMTTGDNNKYLRGWTELDFNHIAFGKSNVEDIDLSVTKWIPYHKGGEQRKWYGNHEYVVNWAEKDNFNRAKTTMTHVYLKPCITWSDISGNTFAGRYCYGGFMFDVKGSCAFASEDQLKILMGIFNSKIMPIYVEALNPTTTTQVGDIKRVPYIEPDDSQRNSIIELVDKCILIAKAEWDSFEFSWDFEKHPLIPSCFDYEKNVLISDCYKDWENLCNNRISEMKELEEKLNSVFIDIYDLQGELNPTVNDKDITLRKADKLREIKSLLSYAVGCMFGRYSLSKKGLVNAGGDLILEEYPLFPADKDNIIPICDDEYFEDDIVNLLCKFLSIVYGKGTLEENLSYIAGVLGGKGTSRDIIRSYFLNDFYADHLKIYFKRPIYWQFESGRKNGFKCLMYMHRYQPDTIARIRTDYVHEQQSRYRTAMYDLEQRMKIASTSDRVKLSHTYTKLKEQANEIIGFEEKIHHLADQMIRIDLDDGVMNNYKIFETVLAKIK